MGSNFFKEAPEGIPLKSLMPYPPIKITLGFEQTKCSQTVTKPIESLSSARCLYCGALGLRQDCVSGTEANRNSDLQLRHETADHYFVLSCVIDTSEAKSRVNNLVWPSEERTWSNKIIHFQAIA